MAIKTKDLVGGPYNKSELETPTVGVIDVPSVPSASPVKCSVIDQGEGCGLTVTFYIGPLEAKRLRMRAQTMSLDRYLYENILFRAISDHVY